ncbi:hypothetical protein V2J09_009571 [Rumex salicifolius]
MVGYVEIDPSSRYGRFGEILGKGAMKTVYRAFDEVLGMEVAWNQVVLTDVFRCPDDLQRLYTEVHLLKNLKHDAIIRFYTSWIDHKRRTFNFITEMFSSGTLREYFPTLYLITRLQILLFSNAQTQIYRQKYKRVDMRAIKNWARQILHGLVYLHRHDPPVIHRDLKCDNIFVNGHLGQVKIGDLGLAAILRGSQHAHSVIGTPEFMAPELYEEDYNELVDVYSFGMCVLEMLTSEYPYSECSNTAQIYKKVTSGKKPNAFYKIQDVEAQRFVGKCLEVVAKRLPAHQLLLDPFLAADVANLPVPLPPLQIFSFNGEAIDDIVKSTGMTITGKMDPQNNTIFLKVQIVSSDGNVRNVHFPFDIVHDTTEDVATEMVKELDITDWEPLEIAEMIEEEISALAPTWKDTHRSPRFIKQHEFIQEEEEEEKDDDDNNKTSNWFESYPIKDDNVSQSSCCDSLKYEISCYSEKDETGEIPSFQERPTMEKSKGNMERKLSKMRSFMDLRSQLLHNGVMKAMHKKRSSKTVGAVESIGFQVHALISDNSASEQRV